LIVPFHYYVILKQYVNSLGTRWMLQTAQGNCGAQKSFVH
jgi:hypothetical protein